MSRFHQLAERAVQHNRARTDAGAGWLLLGNGNRHSHDAATLWVELIHNELESGYSLIPLIGAGFSAPSGLPLLREIDPYLRRCIAMAIGIEEGLVRPWNPRTDQWPRFDPSTFKDALTWRHRILTRIDELSAMDSRARDLPVLHEALGAIAEWRTALQFLARLTMQFDMSGPKAAGFGLLLDAPRQDVRDKFVRAILKGKRPTLGHRMLAAVSGLLRLDLIITTNFDELLEQAFTESRNPLNVVDIHLEDQLPDWSSLSTQRCLLKLHGNSHSFRGDYSLDTPAASALLDRFAQYVSGSPHFTARSIGDSKRAGRPQSHLLVSGVSAGEERTMAFIRHAWDCFDNAFHVYWICHTDQDVSKVQRFTETCNGKRAGIRTIVIRHAHPGLLLLQAFQSLRGTIPNSGVQFPSAARLSLPPLPCRPAATPDAALKEELGKLSNTITSFIGSSDAGVQRLVVVTTEPGTYGLTSACSQVFEDFETKSHSLWIDMDDVVSTDDLFEQLLDAMYYRLGSDSWLPIFVAKEAPGQVDEIKRLARMTVNPWVVFINLRETPGSSQPDFEGAEAPPNGWVDREKRTGEWYESAHLEAFLQFVIGVCGSEPKEPNGPRITVVLMCRQAPPAVGGGLVACLRTRHLVPSDLIKLMPVTTSFAPKHIAKDAIAWAESGSDDSGPPGMESERARRLKFLFEVCLMRRTRFIASTVYRTPLSPAAKQMVTDETERWLKDLADNRLVRRKVGGYMWLHSESRNAVRDLCRSRLKGQLVESDLHWNLALWYQRVLWSSASPQALFEAVYHACLSAETAVAISAMPEARARLDWAADQVVNNSFLVQTVGYSRGSCRRLQVIRDRLCIGCLELQKVQNRGPDGDAVVNALSRLQLSCTDLLRAIGREVGELSKAYLRHREARALLVGKMSGNETEVTPLIYAKALSETPSASDIIQWIRWHKWSGMLALARP